MKKHFCSLLALIMLSTILLTIPNIGIVSAKKTGRWQVAVNGGSCTVNKGVVELTTPTSFGSIPSVAYYTAYNPTNTFVVSFKVQAVNIINFGVEVKATPPYADPFDSVNLEYDYVSAGTGTFRVARYAGSGWIWNDFATGQVGTWYNIKLTVSNSPFQIKAEVFNAKGDSLGSYTVSDMTTLSFSTIRYVAFGVWGFGADYLIKSLAIT